jgi:hypothetical protein
MLSIRFGGEKEWWVSGKVFDRLFQFALDSERLPPGLEQWRHIADANGGFSFDSMDWFEADQLRRGLREAAQHQLTRLENVSDESEAGTYRASLLKLLEASDTR